MKQVNTAVYILIGVLCVSCTTSLTKPIEPTMPVGWMHTVSFNDKAIVMEYCRVPFYENGRTIELEGMLYRDRDLSSYRGVVMTHGRNGPHPKRDPDALFAYGRLNCALAEKGCAVLFLVRRGYGRSEGEDSEFLPSAVESGLAAAQDLKAGVEYVREHDNVRKNGIVIMGHSQGAWAALAASNLSIDGVIATVNIAGGTNYSSMGTGLITDDVQEAWRRGSAIIGQNTLVPVIWIYSENDRNHPKFRVLEMYKAFSEAGGKGFLHILPPYSDNGHLIVQQPSLFLDKIFDDIQELESAGT